MQYLHNIHQYSTSYYKNSYTYRIKNSPLHEEQTHHPHGWTTYDHTSYLQKKWKQVNGIRIQTFITYIILNNRNTNENSCIYNYDPSYTIFTTANKTIRIFYFISAALRNNKLEARKNAIYYFLSDRYGLTQ